VHRPGHIDESPLLRNQLLAAALAALAVALSLLVLSGGTASLPATPHVPAAVVAAGRIESAVAAPTPETTRPRHTRVAVRSVRASLLVRPVAGHVVRRPVRLAVTPTPRPAAPIVPITPAKPIQAAPVAATPVTANQGKQRGKSATRSKGRRGAEVKQSHKKDKPSAPPAEKPGHGNHGAGQGNQGGGRGHQGGK
jgi:hypothetical protein